MTDLTTLCCFLVSLLYCCCRRTKNQKKGRTKHLSAMFGELVTCLFSVQGSLLLVVLVLNLYAAYCLLFRDVLVSDLEKKAVLITGCDSGFGYELAKKLDARGLRVFAACLTSEGQAKLTSECSRQLITLKLDVAEPSDVRKALELVKSHLSSQGIVHLRHMQTAY